MLLEVLSKTASVTMLIFVVTSMIAMGVTLTIGQIVGPLRNVRLVLLVLLANFILMPLVAAVLARVLWLDQPLRAGLLLLGTAAGAPFLPKLVELARGDLAFAVACMALLMVVTVGYLPTVLPLLLPGVNVEPAKVAESLVLLMLLPLAAGLLFEARYSQIAQRLKPFLDRLSNIALILFLLSVLLANIDKFADVFGTRGILAGIVFNAVGLGIGWVLGGPEVTIRSVLALGTGQRNIAAALLVANQDFQDPEVGVMVIVVALIGLLLILPGVVFLTNTATRHLNSDAHASKLGAGDKPPTS
jgi:BASS family bile acid:Na+ symporter